MSDRFLRALMDDHDKNVADARALRNEISEGGGRPTAEQVARVEKLKERAAELKTQIEAEQSLRDLESTQDFFKDIGERARHGSQIEKLDDEGKFPADANDFFRRAARGEPNHVDPVTGQRSREIVLDGPYAQAVRERVMMRAGAGREAILRSREQFIRRGTDEWNTGTSDAGAGNTIQTDVAGMIYDFMERIGGIRRAGPMIITTTQGNPLTLPKDTAHDTTTGATTEGGSATVTSDTLGKTTLSPSKYDGRYDVTRELMQDTAVDIATFITRSIGRTIGRKSETAFATAFLAGVPTANVITATGASTAGAQNGQITVSDVQNLAFELDDDYMQDEDSLTWMMNKMAYRNILDLKDSNNNFYYRRGTGLVDRRPNMVEGSSVVTNPLFPTPVGGTAVKNKPFIFLANFMDYFVIRDVGGIRIRVSTEFKFGDDETVYIGDLRTVGAVLHGVAGAAIKGKNNS